MNNNGERRTTALEVYREVFVGRSDVLSELWDLCLKRRGALVVGDRRVGKTAVLMRLYVGLREGDDQVVIYVGDTARAKPMLVEMARQLYELGVLSLEHSVSLGAAARLGSLPWEGKGKLGARIRALTIPELERLVLASLEGRSAIVILDNFDRLGVGVESFVMKLLDLACVIVAMPEDLWRQKKFRAIVSRLSVRLEIGPLDETNMGRVIEECRRLYPIKVEDEPAWQRAVLLCSAGNPGRAVDILADHALESVVARDQIRQLEASDAVVKIFPISWLLLVALTVFVVMRYVSRGIGDRDGFIIGAVGMTTLIITGFLIRKANKVT